MLTLDDPRWSELRHAYGSAHDIPAKLKSLKVTSRSYGEEEPWFGLWSALAHQGDVYPASFAAVPHVIQMLANDPLHADPSFFHFPTWIEICRRKRSIPVPDDLAPAYFRSLADMPELVAVASKRQWDNEFARVATAAIATAKGHTEIAEVILELNEETSSAFMAWSETR